MKKNCGRNTLLKLARGLAALAILAVAATEFHASPIAAQHHPPGVCGGETPPTCMTIKVCTGINFLWMNRSCKTRHYFFQERS